MYLLVHHINNTVININIKIMIRVSELLWLAVVLITLYVYYWPRIYLYAFPSHMFLSLARKHNDNNNTSFRMLWLTMRGDGKVCYVPSTCVCVFVLRFAFAPGTLRWAELSWTGLARLGSSRGHADTAVRRPFALILFTAIIVDVSFVFAGDRCPRASRVHGIMHGSCNNAERIKGGDGGVWS